jgi:CheY-like chemotaxis protein
MAGTSKKRILVVEDEQDTRDYISALLEDNGYLTIPAADGVECMALVEKERPDLITLDVSIPEQSGVRVYRTLKEDPELAKIPVIIITGLGQPFKTFIDRTHRVPSPEGFISKPFEKEQLLQLVRDLLPA